MRVITGTARGRKLAALEGLTLTSSNPHDFEVVGDGVDKGRSLAKRSQRM